MQCVIHLLVLQAESSLASSPCPGELQGRNLCPLLVAVTTSAENLGDAACYKVGVRMKVWRIISFYQIPISLS